MARGDCGWTLLGLLIVISVAAAFPWILGISTRRRKKAFDAMGRGLAKRLGGVFAPGAWPVLSFAAHGRPSQLHWGRYADERGGSTMVAVDLRGHSPGVLKILPEGVGSLIGKLFGAQDIRIGDKEFDSRFVVKANPESLAHRFFGPERRPAVFAVVTRFDGRLRIDLSRQQLVVALAGTLEAEADLERLARTAIELTGLLLDLSSAEVLWLEDPRVPVLQCQVCGSELRDRVVDCARCRTPHHEECWRYAGVCSTYACRETAYVRDGRVVRAGQGR